MVREEEGAQLAGGLQISDLARRSGVPPKTIRYYEQIALLPPARRGRNGYRLYRQEDVERLRFIRSARRLDFPLDELREVLALRERGEAPCQRVSLLLKQRVSDVEERIAQLRALQVDLEELVAQAGGLPEDVEMKGCVCHLIRARG